MAVTKENGTMVSSEEEGGLRIPMMINEKAKQQSLLL